MNPGGEPERDESGLPPVDIEVPDDARELDRDVQAYRRELRALRRIARRGRWHRSLSKDGVVLPLLACCLILALITGTLLTVFTATSNQTLGLPGPPASAPRPQAALTPEYALPDGMIAVDGQRPVSVSTLTHAMLVLVPPDCSRCAASVNWLAGVGYNAGATVYLIYTSATNADARQLARQVSGPLLLAEDVGDRLTAAKGLVGIPASELTAILVGPNRAPTWVSRISPSDDQAPLLRALKGQSA